MSSSQTPTQVIQLLGSVFGLLLFFTAPFLADFGAGTWVAMSRRTLLSNLSSSEYQVFGFAIMVTVLLVATLLGLVTWGVFFRRFRNDLPGIYIPGVILSGTVTLVINLLWRLIQLTIGIGLSFQSPSGGLNLPSPFNLIFWIFGFGLYAFAHPILTILVLRYHWHLAGG